MPTRPPSYCTNPGCSALVQRGKCPRCRPPRTRHTKPHPIYGTALWRRTRAAKLRDTPLCETPRCPHPPAHVDHIDGDPTNLAPANLQALCAPCHSRKTVAHDGGFGNPRTPR